MLKKLSAKTNFILIGIVVGLFVGVSIRQALGDTNLSGTTRADNLTVNTGRIAANGLAVSYGNVLIAEGRIGVNTLNPQVALDVVGDGILSGTVTIQNGGQTPVGLSVTHGDVLIPNGRLCFDATTCINKTEMIALKALIGGNIPTKFKLIVTKSGTGSGTVTSVASASNEINCGSTCSFDFPANTLVTLTANPSPGSTFTGWGGWCGGTSTCQASMTEARNVTATFTQSGTTPPSATTCTGNHPDVVEGNGVQLSYFNTDKTCVGGGGACAADGVQNTVWKYGDRSCGWSCVSPKVQNGDAGCKDQPKGSGVTVTVNDLSTGKLLSGVGVDVWFSAYAIAGSRSLGSYTTGTNGQTTEFWVGKQADKMPSSMLGMVITKDGYKIRRAIGCAFDVRQRYDHRGAQMNNCNEPSDGTPVVIDMVPGDISTRPTAYFEKSTYRRGEIMKGYIEGGDPNNTWACIDNPMTPTAEKCDISEQGWRQLTKPYNGQADDWKLIETNQGDTLRMANGLTIGQSSPLGTYTSYLRTGERYDNPDSLTRVNLTVE